MNNKEISALSLEACHEKLILEKESLRKLRFANAISPIENPMQIRQNRRRIARLKTAIKAKHVLKD